MKTLKKTLCLVLALVMVVGTLAISASAADFDDADKIEYTEAVNVLTAIKVIDGKDGNKYDPAGTLTREQGAAIVVRALLTRATADALPTGGTAFEDVSGWSTKYVTYAAAEHILDGVGGNKFNPQGELTGTAFAKMLLVAIGVDGEYTGANWATNVFLAAQKAKLADGIADFNYDAAITRDQAAQMAYNAINFSTQGATTAYKVTKNGKTLYEGTDAVVALLMQNSNAGAELELVTVTTGSIADATYGLKRNETTDAFGRSTVTVTGNNKVKVVISEDAVLTYENGTTAGKIAADLGAAKVSDKYELTVIEDGVAGSTISADKTMTKAANAIGGNGSLIEVYQTGTSSYNVIVINTYVAKLAKADITAAKKATATTDAEAAYITISGMTYETDAFKVGDVVLYTKAGNTIQNVQKADYVSGSVTALGPKNAYTKIEGTQYEDSRNADASVAALAYTLDKSVNTYYLDNYGNLIFAEAGKVADVETDYIYVIQTAAKASETKTTGGSNLFETDSNTTAAQAQAQVIDIETGAVSVKNIGVVKGNDNKYYYATKTGSVGTVEVTDQKATAEMAIFEYATLTNGDIVLVGKADTESVSLNKGQATIATGKVANSATKLTIVETKQDPKTKAVTATSKSYTGIANFIKVSGDAVVEYSNNPNTLATRIILVKEAAAPETKVNYAIFAGEGESDGNGTQLAFYVDGEVVSYYGEGVKASDLTEKAIYDVTITNGKVTKATSVSTKSGKVTLVDATYVIVGGEVVYLASGYTVVDSTDGYAKGTIAVDDDITYAVNAKGELTFAVIG